MPRLTRRRVAVVGGRTDADRTIALLERSGDLEVAGCWGCLAEATGSWNGHAPDAAVVDAGALGVEPVEELALFTARRDVPLLVLASREDPAYVALMLSVGVRGLISSTAGPDAVEGAARTVAGGGRHVPLGALLEGTGNVHPYIGLAAEDRDLLRHALRGAPAYRLAYDLGLPSETVSHRLDRIYGVLGAEDRPSAVRALVEAGILAGDPARTWRTRRRHAVVSL
jgi:DNA-binding NarL/FixJ family response regulator